LLVRASDSAGHRHEARAEPGDEQQAAEAFGGAGQIGVENGQRDPKAAKKLRCAFDI
jgi:hypothetical protein